ncbi:MAG: ribosome silencing factor [Sneathiella sp.]|nr:ribosome silencing factor [Sneathiella sp.]
MNAKEEVVAKLRDLVQASLLDDKAEDVVSIDLSGKTSFADYMIIANGRSSRQVGAMADHLKERIKDEGFGVAKIEGKANGDWVLVDAGDIIIHLFRPEVREFYNLEKIWAESIPAEMIS